MKLPLTPTRFLERAGHLYADKTAIVCGDARLTYAGYRDRVHALSGALASLGVGRGDRVAYLGMNHHRLLELYYGILPLGAILTPMNVRLHPEEMVFILQDLGAKALFVDHALKGAAASIIPRLASLERIVFTGDIDPPDGWLPYEALLAGASTDPVEGPEIDEDDVAEIFYTSGTTGKPKGVMLTHRNLYLHALQVIPAIGITDRTIQVVGTVPLFHVNAWGAPQYLVAMGATQVVTPRFEPRAFCELVQQERATLSMMVPTMLADLVAFDEAQAYDLSSLERIIIGGAPPPYALLRSASERFRVEIQVGYGLSETSPVLTVSNLKSHRQSSMSEEERYRRLCLTGLPLVGVEIRVVDGEGRDVPADGRSVGEILVRGDVVMKGYWRRPEETDEALEGGWFHTGDMATVDGEGYLQIVDRKKDIIITGGENVSSVEIEDALYTHPHVRECAVIGVPHPRWGEVPYAFVVPKPDASVTAQDLILHVSGRLARFKAPSGVTFAQTLPRTGTGKVQKEELRRLFWEGQAQDAEGRGRRDGDDA